MPNLGETRNVNHCVVPKRGQRRALFVRYRTRQSCLLTIVIEKTALEGKDDRTPIGTVLAILIQQPEIVE
jgi:hypothetical protein